MKGNERDLRTIARELKEKGMRCNCDLDAWEPERTTGHTQECRIHRRAIIMKYQSYDLKGKTKWM